MKRFASRSMRSVALSVITVVALAILWQIDWLNATDQVVANDASEEVSSDTAIPVVIVRAGSVSPPTLAPSFAGMLTARRDSDLAFGRGGRVVSIEIEEGDSIRKGDVLARLDVTGIDATQERLAGPRTQTISAAGALVRQLEA